MEPQEAARVIGMPGGRDRPSWAPPWAPSGSTLSYLANGLVVVLALLALAALAGFEAAGQLRRRIR